MIKIALFFTQTHKKKMLITAKITLMASIMGKNWKIFEKENKRSESVSDVKKSTSSASENTNTEHN